MAPKPKSPDFERPADFDVKAYAQRSPWTFTSEPPEEVQLALSPRPPRSATRTSARRGGQAPATATRTLVTFDCSEPRVRRDAGARGQGRDPRRRAATGCARGSPTSSTRSPTHYPTEGSRCRVTSRSELRRLLYIVPYVAKHPEGVPVDAAREDARRRARRAARRSRAALAGRPARRRSRRIPAGLRRGGPRVRRSRAPPDAPAAPDAGRGLLAAARHPRAARERHRAVRRGDAVGREEAAHRARPRRERGPEPRDLHRRRRARCRGRRRTCARSSPPRASASASRLDYASASRTRPRRRPIDPYGIVHHAGEWYVVGSLPQARRRPHVPHRSHRGAASRPAERFERPANFDLEAYRRERLYVPSADAVTVRIAARPARGHPDRRELAGRRGHDAGRRLGRAARSTATASSGSPAGCSRSAATPASSVPSRPAPPCARESTRLRVDLAA